MQAIIQELAELHAAEAATLWVLDDPDLHDRIAAHLDGLLVCMQRGADPLSRLDRPWRGADLFPAAWLARTARRDDLTALASAADDDDEGRRAIAAAAAWP
jgi:hypothetical protein